MTTPYEHLEHSLEEITAAGYRDRLLDRGLARGMIWRDGVLPDGAPRFAEHLSDDLLDYGHTVLYQAIQLKEINPDSGILDKAFLVAGESIESAINRGAVENDSGFHRVTSAVAFHIARYSARAFSMLPIGHDEENLSPLEECLVGLMRRDFRSMHRTYSEWLLDDDHSDEEIASRLREDDDYAAEDCLDEIIISGYLRAIALFHSALKLGEQGLMDRAMELIETSRTIASKSGLVPYWWTISLSRPLMQELWALSLHNQIPSTINDADREQSWGELRKNYIQKLFLSKRSAVEVWPSQQEAVRRSIDPEDDLVVALPTSAGKTRIAELCILRALAEEKRIVYITPLRALSAQIERDLAETFVPLGVAVTSLYGAAGVEDADKNTLRTGQVVVCTPEKLDFALRNDATVIDDVGLIVLDEGHMIGPNEREVRYEALVQRLLRRHDAESRRFVCLSALFPTPVEMADLVSWIRQDLEGDPIHSTWRPTRQRYGVVRWENNTARLDVKVEDETPFVPRFIRRERPPAGSRRRNSFPNSKNELTLATAQQFTEQGKRVLVYSTIRASVETLGKAALTCIRQGVLSSFQQVNSEIEEAMKTGAEWLGTDHPAVKCLEYGIALHHGGLPRPYLAEVERLMRNGNCPLTIASPTLAQGLNLSASVLLIPNLWRNREIIPASEFANVAGRAGRAFVDIEGLILHIVWEQDRRSTNRAVNKWSRLLRDARAPLIKSGILTLTRTILERIVDIKEVDENEVIEYVLGVADAWLYIPNEDVEKKEWDRDVASLDSAILAVLDAEVEEEFLSDYLDSAFERSLYTRQLGNVEEGDQETIYQFVVARAKKIWGNTTIPQRTGYHRAGIGFDAGQYIDANIEELYALLRNAEAYLVFQNLEELTNSVVSFAELAFRNAPFQPPRDLPENWQECLKSWLRGESASDVLSVCDNESVDLLQEALAYRLPWAIEAVRVHAIALGMVGADALKGQVALAVESGSASLSVITLMRHGLTSRDAAILAVRATEAQFDDVAGMHAWLVSESIRELSGQEDWPSAETRHSWLRFYSGDSRQSFKKWERDTISVDVTWGDEVPDIGSRVRIEFEEGGYAHIYSSEYEWLGVVHDATDISPDCVVDATVFFDRSVMVETYGETA